MTDTWRQDHFGLYGHKTVRTPNIDRFSDKCVTFNRCYANSYPTMPCRADVFTGKWTYAHAKWGPLPRGERVISQILQREKYQTGIVVDTPFFNAADMNYTTGFQNIMFIRGQNDRRDTSFEIRYESDYISPKTMIEASNWLERNNKKDFYLYVDTWDPHEPWNVPQWYAESYYPGYDGRYCLPPYWYYKEAGLTDEDVEKTHAMYCAEITMVDRWVGYLLDSIESMNLMDDTAIIFTSDHGFYFGEHGMCGKTLMPFLRNFRTSKNKPAPGRYRSPLYEEITNVPLLIYVPGVKARRVDDVVGLADLMPTVLELMDVEIPNTVQATSLVPMLMGEERKGIDFAVTSSGLDNVGGITREVDHSPRPMKEWECTTITTQEWSLLYAAEDQPAELYHRPSDPKQEKNVIKENPEIAQDLLDKFIWQMEVSGTSPRLLDVRRRF